MMRMKQMSHLEIHGPVTVHLQGGRIVARGKTNGQRGHLVGRARVEQQDDQTVIYGDHSIVLALPEETNVTLKGDIRDAVLKGLGRVRLEACDGNLTASYLTALHATGTIAYHATMRRVADIKLGSVKGHLSVKHSPQLDVESVEGSLSLKGVQTVKVGQAQHHFTAKGVQTLRLQQVQGEASLKRVEDAEIDEIEGRLSVSKGGRLSVNRVQGDTRLAALSGNASLKHVAGNLSIENPGPSLHAEKVEGDVYLSGALQAGGEYTIHAQGDVTLVTKSNVHVVVHAKTVELPEGVEAEKMEDGSHHLYLGERDNAAHLTIQAEGIVRIEEKEAHHHHHHHRRRHRHRGSHRQQWRWRTPQQEWDVDVDLDVDLEEEIRRAMEEVQSELHRASQTVREELKRAFQEIDDTTGFSVGNVIRSTMNEFLSALRPQEEEHVREKPVSPPPAAASASSSGEELQMILRMVENGTITAEEAERLIQAMK